ncbi:MAG: tRNA pseudouridine(55) synthase TruB [Armatimonadetes bacterium]|nr:tRNA pseudouridine(55) synthase TruB [Armatimonadota bacterium]
MLGILVVDKPQGLTSHDVVNRVRRSLGTRRVGHAGSLDPMATGVLVLAVGPATRFLQYLPLEPKVYEGVITFGTETTTQDAEGDVVQQRPVPHGLEAELLDTIPDFVGEIHQIPPMYSAIKKDGKPLYAYARAGQEVERESRMVFINQVDVLEITGYSARVRVECSGGTYMRTFAHDIGEAIGCGAHLSELRRIQVGKFDLASAISLEEVTSDHLLPLNVALPPMPLIPLNPVDETRVRCGQTVKTTQTIPSRLVGLVNTEGQVFAAARVDRNLLKPECVIPSEAVHGVV